MFVWQMCECEDPLTVDDDDDDDDDHHCFIGCVLMCIDIFNNLLSL